MLARKTTESLGVRLARWAWFRTFTRAVFGPAIEQIVAEQTNQTLVDVFRHHRREFDALDKRISERFDLCQELIAQNVGKLRKEHAEKQRTFAEAVRRLEAQLELRAEAGR